MTARDVARRVLARVAGGAFTTLALAGELGRSRLSDVDRAFATELVHGVLKRGHRLDRALAACAPRGLGGVDARTLDALRLAAHQILFLRVPAHAAVDDAVGAVRRLRGARLAGFANAILRRLAREGEPPLPPDLDPIARLEIVESAPRWLVERLVATLGADDAARALAAFNAPSPTWLRVNTLRTTRDALAEALRAERPAVVVAPSPRAPDALGASHGGDLFSTTPYARGHFVAQDVGAQLVVRLLDARKGERLLDACSGVGGKASYLAALTGDGAAIDAADLSERKLALAADHAHRLGVTSVRAVVADLADPAAPLAPRYDRVLLDAPCSGLGVLRRHPEAKWRTTPDDVAALAAMQRRLLDALAPRVAPGGALVYAVCTFTDEEGPAQVAAFAARHPAFTVEETLTTWPHRDDADAFYAVRLRRAADR